MHPYSQRVEYEPSFKFRVLFHGERDFELYETKPLDHREENMMNAFYLRDVYRYHEDLEVMDLVKLQRECFGGYLLKMMEVIFRGMVFGAEIDTARMNDSPMTKLKKDLLVQFWIIDEKGEIYPDLLRML